MGQASHSSSKLGMAVLSLGVRRQRLQETKNRVRELDYIARVDGQYDVDTRCSVIAWPCTSGALAV